MLSTLHPSFWDQRLQPHKLFHAPGRTFFSAKLLFNHQDVMISVDWFCMMVLDTPWFTNLPSPFLISSLRTNLISCSWFQRAKRFLLCSEKRTLNKDVMSVLARKTSRCLPKSHEHLCKCATVGQTVESCSNTEASKHSRILQSIYVVGITTEADFWY